MDAARGRSCCVTVAKESLSSTLLHQLIDLLLGLDIVHKTKLPTIVNTIDKIQQSIVSRGLKKKSTIKTLVINITNILAFPIY